MKKLIIAVLVMLGTTAHAEVERTEIEGVVRQVECGPKKGIFELLVKGEEEIKVIWLRTTAQDLLEKNATSSLFFSSKICVLAAIGAENTISSTFILSKFILENGMVVEMDSSQQNSIAFKDFFKGAS